jgi:hypothetical protein
MPTPFGYSFPLPKVNSSLRGGLCLEKLRNVNSGIEDSLFHSVKRAWIALFLAKITFPPSPSLSEASKRRAVLRQKYNNVLVSLNFEFLICIRMTFSRCPQGKILKTIIPSSPLKSAAKLCSADEKKKKKKKKKIY